MSTESDRDTSVDRLLRAELRGSEAADLPPASPSCVDAEMLAAWADGALPADQSGAVEAHLADCARCQAMMAVFARTAPVAAEVVPLRPRWSMGWMIPIAAGTLAASLLIWIAWPSRQVSPGPVETMAKSEGRSAEGGAVTTAPTAASADRAANEAKDLQKKEVRGTESATPSLPTSALSRVPAQTVPLSAPPPGPRAAPAPVPAPPAVAPPPATAVVAPPRGLLSQAAGQTAPAFRAAVPESPTTVVAEFTAPEVASAAIGGAAGVGRAGGRGGGGGGRGGGGAVGADELARRAPPLRWRVIASGAVERSATAGASWERVAIDPPDLTITGGAAPAPLVCWLIGRAGVVLLSTDGLHFTRVPFPDAIDLSSIRATSALEVTVTASDGRVFVTNDGGRTWRVASR